MPKNAGLVSVCVYVCMCAFMCVRVCICLDPLVLEVPSNWGSTLTGALVMLSVLMLFDLATWF